MLLYKAKMYVFNLITLKTSLWYQYKWIKVKLKI